MEWSLLPLITHINFKALATTETAHGFNRINLLRVFPILNFNEGVMQRGSQFLITEVDIDSFVNQELLCFKCCISCCTGHVNCMMKQVATFVINLVDVTTTINQFLN